MKIELELNDYLAMIRQLGFCQGALESIGWALSGNPSADDIGHLVEASKVAAERTKALLDKLDATPPASPPQPMMSGTGTER